MPTPVVVVRGFRKRYRHRTAVDGADLELRAGEVHGLIGPDGAGKSSLMKAIAGVLTFDAGEVAVFGTSLVSERDAESVKDRIGFMPQGLGLNLYPNLTVEENIDFFARLRLLDEAELSRRKARLLTITRLGTFRTRAMRHLSGGMKQKLGLICTLIHEPRLLILDEPTTGVDPVSRRDFWDILGELMREQGISALISTAYLDEASRFDRVTLMYMGKVMAHGEPEDIASRVRGTVVSLSVADQMSALRRLKPEFPQTQVLGPVMRVFVEEPDAETAVRRVTAAAPDAEPSSLAASTPELEDAFVALLQTGRPATGWMPSGEETARAVPGNGAGAAIEAVGLTKTFGDFTAVDDVSFTVPSGEIFGLLGANGAGKTTVIKMLTGILSPTRGIGQVAGADMRTASHAIKEHIGYMSQSFSLYAELTVLENIRLYAGVYGLDRRTARERLQWVLEMAGLSAHQRERAEALPMGLRQRLALGCALVHRPGVLFLDEPTAGVDAAGRRQLWEILFHLSRSLRVAILVTTHYMSEAEHCDQLALMHSGSIVASGSPAQMKRAIESEVGKVLQLSTSDPRRALAVLRAAGFDGASLFGSHVHLHSRSPEQDEIRIRVLLESADLQLRGAVERPVSMEDVFVSRVTRLESLEAAASAANSSAAAQSRIAS